MPGCDKIRNQKGAPPRGKSVAVGQRDAAVVARVKKEIGEILGKSPGSIRVTDQFIRDLGADSFDTVEIVMAIEEEFNIAIADADAEKLIAVGDLVDYVTASMKPVPVDAGNNKSGTSYEVAGIYTSMRSMVLNLDAGKIGELKDKPVWPVLMETGYPEAAATLVAVADGAASLYFSNGGGIINPHFPALRSGPLALSGASRRKQSPDSSEAGGRRLHRRDLQAALANRD